MQLPLPVQPKLFIGAAAAEEAPSFFSTPTVLGDWRSRAASLSL